MEVTNADNYLYDRRKKDIPVEHDRRNRTDHSARQKNLLKYTFDAIPTFRRLESAEGNIENGNAASAVGMAGLALINLPSDKKDIIGAAKQVKATLKGKKLPAPYDYFNYQHDFSFFRDTAIEKWMVKHAMAGKKWAKWLLKNDTTLADSKTGEHIIKNLNVEQLECIDTTITNAKNEAISAYKYKGTAFGKLTAKALRRTTKIGLIATGLLETPKIFNAAFNGDNLYQKLGSVVEQTTKSALNVALITAGIGYCGAIGSKYGKGLGSLLGIGIGAIAGSKLSEKIQNIS